MNKFEIYQPINFDNFIWSTEEPLLFPANDCLKFDGEDSPLQTSKNTFLSSGEENGLSFDIDSFTDKHSESQSVSKKSTCFNDAAYEEVAEIVHSDDTDLNLLLEDVLSAGPVDPTVKRVKRKNPLLKKKQMKRTRKSKDQVEKLMEAQLALGDPKRYPDFKGNVAGVETRDFQRTREESPSKQEYHWMRNWETYYLIGKSMGDAMVKLLPAQ